MIPLRIQLAGFLCYREPQEACFEGRTLWMLAGPNGSGKSALFDAMTYVLFGQHRGGKQNSHGLIHHDCDRLTIEFDFQLDNHLYRARRTLSRRGRSTRQILARSDNDEEASGTWTVVSETHTERGFSQWINANIALTYDSFTASVLLLQGKADNLLLATPAQRHRLLCHIVGIDRIEELAKQARYHLSQTDGTVRACRQQVQQLTPDETSCVEGLRQQAVAGDQRFAQQNAEVERIRNRVEQATRWQHLTTELTNLQTEIDGISEQLERWQQSDSLQRRHAELSAHMPALRQLSESTAHLDRCRVEIGHLESALSTAQAQHQQLETDLLDTEQTIAAVRQKLADTQSQEQQLSRKHTEQVLVHSTAHRLVVARDRLRQTRESQSNLETQLQETRDQHAALRKKLPSDQAIESAQYAARATGEQIAQHEILADQVRQRLARCQTVAGKQSCPYCQQPLDHAHHVRETERLEEELLLLDATLNHKRQEGSAALEHEHALRKHHAHHRASLEELNLRIQQLDAELKATDMVARELVDQCQRAHQDLPAAIQARLSNQATADWSAVAFPSGDDLISLQQQACNTATALAQSERNQQSLQEELTKLIEQHRNMVARRQIAAHRRDECREQLAQQRGQLCGYSALQTSARTTVPRQWRDLSATDLSNLIQSISEASQKDLPTLSGPDAMDLDTLTYHHRTLQARHDVLTEQRSQIAAAAQCDPAPIKLLLQDAQTLLHQLELERTTLQSQLIQTEERVTNHQAAEDRLRAAQQDCRLWKRITKLLGHDGLQRALLESTEREIVQYTNTILDRLSGGQLYIELAQSNTGRARNGKALELVARTTGTGTHEQEVAFLSGSQKFRVAVALSLAIGQFASNTRRPVQAVIIDEGFGCLDTANRHVMIQELQNLRGHLQRILLVSHQDEFASAFSDGYRCELINGATQLTPFHA